MMEIKYRRSDGSFVAIVNGLPYHVTSDDPLFGLACEAGKLAPMEPAVPQFVPSANDVKAEAERRIIAICPEWKQRNLIAQAVMLQHKGHDKWTAEDRAAWNAGQALWEKIAAIRAASDVIETMDPIPADYTAFGYWDGDQ